MGRNTLKGLKVARYLEAHEQLQGLMPQVYAFMTDEDSFASIRVYAKNDSTYMAVLNGYDAEGTPVVCFGTAYDVVGCFLGLEGAVAANKWRPDKPWEGKKE